MQFVAGSHGRVCSIATVVGKMRKLTSGGKQGRTEPAASDSVPASIRSRPDNSVSIFIHAKPGSKSCAITEVGEARIGIQINAPAKDGEANEALLSFLAEVFGTRKRDVTLGSGTRSREKIVIVEGLSATDAYSILRKAVTHQHDSNM